jgi:hypothetical protein
MDDPRGACKVGDLCYPDCYQLPLPAKLTRTFGCNMCFVRGHDPSPSMRFPSGTCTCNTSHINRCQG